MNQKIKTSIKIVKMLNERMRFKNLKNQCEECKTTKNLTAHHIKPKSEGGDNSLKNIQILCRKCHDKIHNIKRKKWSSNKIQLLNTMIKNKYNIELILKTFDCTKEDLDKMIKKYVHNGGERSAK